MAAELEVLSDVVARLDGAAIPYMLTGSIALSYVSREDLILSKLAWAKDSGSEMQMRDVRALLAADVDREYLERWAPELSVTELLESLDAGHDTRSFNITYKDSTNLSYKEDDKTIHSNYNGWIKNLEKAIRAQVTVL